MSQGQIFSREDLEKLGAVTVTRSSPKVFSMAEMKGEMPHVSTKVTYQGPVEDKEDVWLLSSITELNEQFWSHLTSGNMDMVGSAAEAFSAAMGDDPEQSIGRHVQNWVNENRDEDAVSLSRSEAWEEGPLGILHYLGGLLGAGLGSFGGQIVGAGIGAGIGSVVPGVGTTIGGIAGLFGAGTLMNVGSTYRQLRDEGVDLEAAGRVSILVGSGLGVIDSLAAGKLLGATAGKGIKKAAIDKIVKQLAASSVKQVGKAAGKGLATEGITETIQAGIQEATAATMTGNLDLKRRTLNALEEGLAGAMTGGVIGGGKRAGEIGVDRLGTPPGTPSPAPATPAPVPAPTPAPPTPAPVPAPAPVPVPAPIPVPEPPAPAQVPAPPTPAPVPAPAPPAPAQVPTPPTPVPVPEPEAPAPVPTPDPIPTEAPTPAAPVPAPAPIEGPTGSETILRTPKSDHKAHYRIVEADSLQPSHNAFTFEKNEVYPEGVQERQYHSNPNAQKKVIHDSQNLKPDMMINTTPTAIDGPPQVTAGGIVLGGNGRTMAAKRAYLEGNAEGYREYLLKNSKDFGISEDQVQGMKQPVLIREVDNAPADTEGLRLLGSALNKDFKKALSEIEVAVSAGKNLSKESADQIGGELEAIGESATLRSLMAKNPAVFRDALLRDGVLSETDLPQYFTQEGAVNDAGKNFIENALVGAVVQDTDLLQSMPKSLVAKVERIVPQMIELGNRTDGWNISQDVRDAVRQISSAHIRGIKIQDQLRQTSMFGEGPSQKAKALALAFEQKPTAVAAVFKAYANDARTDVEGQGAMFGKGDPEEAFGRLFGTGRPKKTKKGESGAKKGKAVAFAADRPTLPSLAKSEMSTELVRRSQILTQLSDQLHGLPIRLGRITQKNALGIYKVKGEVVRLRQANDLAVAMHEVGHHLNKLIYGGAEGELNTAPLKEFSGELDKIATKGNKNAEGFAEFVRLYLTDPGQAMNVAPNFHHAFEKKMAEMPEIRDILADTRKHILRYQEQPSAAKVLAHINKENTPVPADRFSRIYTDMVDALTPIRRVVEIMEKDSGKKLNTEENGYELSRLFAGWVGKADHFLQKGTFDPSKTELDVTGKPLKAILSPVTGKLDELRILLTARRVVEKEGQGKETGLTLEDAEKAIEDVSTPELETAAKELYEYQDQVLLYMVKSKYLSKEQYGRIKALNKAFVPFYRVMEDGPGKGGGTGKSLVDLWNPVKRMKGSSREIIDPLESIVKNTYTFINLSERNKVALALADQAGDTEGGGKWVEKVPAKMTAQSFSLEEIKSTMKKAGIDVGQIDAKEMEAVATIFRPLQKGNQAENIVSAFRDGETELYQVQPDLYRALTGMDAEQSNLLITIMSKPAALLRLGATGISPEFLSRNPIRDAWTAFIQSRNGFKPGVDTAMGLFHTLKQSDLYHEWRRSGGEHAAMVSMDRTNLQQNLKDMLASKTKMAARHPIETARWLSEQLEASTRMGEYRLARKKGKSPAKSALDSREVTLDFARVGAATQGLNRIAAFFNANIQGTDKMIRAFKENPKGATVKAVAGITLPSLLLYAVNKDDEKYKELPKWQKDFFWMIPTKGTNLEAHTPFVPVPKPFLLGLTFGSSVERTLEWINDKNPEAFDGFLNSIAQAGVPSPMPTGSGPVLEAWANKSFFTGRSIVPRYLERLPPEHQFEPWTSEFSRSMAKMFKKAGSPASPMKIENTLFGYTAGAGKAVAWALDPLLRDPDAPEKPTRTMADIPGVRAFAVRSTGSTESMQKFYDRLADLDQLSASEVFGKKYRGRIPLERMKPAERREYAILRKAQRRMSDLSIRIRQIEASKRPGEEKREQIDKWSARRSEIAARTMGRLRKHKK